MKATLLAMSSGRRSGLIVLPTGTGKTATFLSLASAVGGPVLVLVHRDELVRQTIRAAETWWPGATTGVVQAQERDWRGRDLVVASVNSLHAKRRAEIPGDAFGLVIVDECHHAASPSWIAVLSHFSGCGFCLGVTATPSRLDGKPLTHFGAEPLYSYSIYQAVQDGRLVPVISKRIATTTDLDGIASRVGDFAQGQLSRVVNTPDRNRIVVDAYLDHARGRRAIVFCADISHAEALAQEFDSALVRGGVVHGDRSRLPLDERRALLEQFARGELDLLLNCEVLTEGYDDPGVDCVIWARPTESRTLYVQGTGRGLRLAPGKENCLILDITDNCTRHKLVTVADMLGRQKSSRGEVGQVPSRQPGGSGGKDPGAVVSWRLDEVCPWPGMPGLDGYAPTMPWHDDKASPGQVKFLRSFGLEVSGGLTKGEASYLIDRANEYESAYPRPATPRQEFTLKREGLWVDGMGRRLAGQLITQIKLRERNHQWAG